MGTIQKSSRRRIHVTSLSLLPTVRRRRGRSCRVYDATMLNEDAVPVVGELPPSWSSAHSDPCARRWSRRHASHDGCAKTASASGRAP
jgi:hypothetical protein